MSKVAALYVDMRGVYPKLLGPEMCWDEERDARTYEGPWPVVAHPPCGPWSSLRHLYSRPEEKEIGLRAVEQVQRWGGVLEQPAGSKLWDACTLPLPGYLRPAGRGTHSLAVEQVAWGHPARKKTWLLLVGIDRDFAAREVRTGGTPTHWVSGGRRHSRKGSGGFAPEGIKICSAQQRNRTPIAFAQWLIELAATSTPPGGPGGR